MNKFKIITVSSVVSIVAYSLVQILSSNEYVFAVILGKSFGLQLFSFLITTVIFKFSSSPNELMEQQNKRYLKVFGIVCSTIFFLSILPTFINTESKDSVDKIERKTKEFKYSPDNCEYSVIFSSEPVIKETTFSNFDKNFIGETAEYISDQDFSFQRTTFVQIPKENVALYTKESVTKILSDYANANGGQMTEINYSETADEKIGTMRSIKKLTSRNNEKIPITYFAKMYIKNKTLFVVYTGAKSSMYPTPQISSFLNSVQSK